jgi:hypothetical protein
MTRLFGGSYYSEPKYPLDVTLNLPSTKSISEGHVDDANLLI